MSFDGIEAGSKRADQEMSWETNTTAMWGLRIVNALLGIGGIVLLALAGLMVSEESATTAALTPLIVVGVGLLGIGGLGIWATFGRKMMATYWLALFFGTVLVESPEGVEPEPKHTLGDAAHAMQSAEWLLREAEEVLAVHDEKQDIFGGGKHRAGCLKQRNELRTVLAEKLNKLMTKKRRAAASARGDGGGGASKKHTTSTTGSGCMRAKLNTTPKAVTSGGGHGDGKEAEFCTSLPPHPRASSFPLRAEGAKRGNHMGLHDTADPPAAIELTSQYPEQWRSLPPSVFPSAHS